MSDNIKADSDSNEVVVTSDDSTTSTSYILSNNAYNIMKWLAMLFLPALATFIATVGNSVTWSYTSIVCTIITALAAFIGAMCGISTITSKTTTTDKE